MGPSSHLLMPVSSCMIYDLIYYMLLNNMDHSSIFFKLGGIHKSRLKNHNGVFFSFSFLHSGFPPHLLLLRLWFHDVLRDP